MLQCKIDIYLEMMPWNALSNIYSPLYKNSNINAKIKYSNSQDLYINIH